MPNEEPTVEEIYQAFWKDILEKETCMTCSTVFDEEQVTNTCPKCGGALMSLLQVEQVKKELHDFTIMIQEVPKVYSHVTGGMVSKPLTYASAVNSAADDNMQRLIKDDLREICTSLHDEVETMQLGNLPLLRLKALLVKYLGEPYGKRKKSTTTAPNRKG